MNDLFNAPLFKLLTVVKRYIGAVRSNNVLELSKLKQEQAELFTDEFREYLKEWLGAFGISNEMLDNIKNNMPFNEIGETNNSQSISIH